MHRNAKRSALTPIFKLAICIDTNTFDYRKEHVPLTIKIQLLQDFFFKYIGYLKYFLVYDSETVINYIVGDERVSENPALGGMHVIWVRQHNHIAQRLAKITSWSSYKIFQETRKIIGAMLQFITYKHYLPKILSPKTLARQVSFNACLPLRCTTVL